MTGADPPCRGVPGAEGEEAGRPGEAAEASPGLPANHEKIIMRYNISHDHFLMISILY